jgi:hypothetical protein
VTEEGEDVLWFNKFPPPVKKVFLKIHALVKWEWFNSIICELQFLSVVHCLSISQN